MHSAPVDLVEIAALISNSELNLAKSDFDKNGLIAVIRIIWCSISILHLNCIKITLRYL